MTRCYEAYVYFKKNPHQCKSDRTMQNINKYIEFMESKNVQFSKTKTDKMLFLKLREQYGVERVVIQPQHVARVVECAKCGFGASTPVQIKGEFYHKECAPIVPMETAELKTPCEEECSTTPEVVLKDTEVIVECPICNSKHLLIHVEPTGVHRLREVIS